MNRREGYPLAPSEPVESALGPVGYTIVPEPDLAIRVGRIRGFIRRRFWLILACLVPFVGIAAAYSHFAPRVYESGATFLLEARVRDGLGSSLELLDRIGRVGRIENEVELLKSRRVIAPAVNALDLHVVATENGTSGRPADLLEGFDARIEVEEDTYLLTTDDSATTHIFSEVAAGVIVQANAGDTVRVAGISFIAPSVPGREIGLETADFDRTIRDVTQSISVARVGREADLIQLVCRAPQAVLARDLCAEVSTSYLILRNELQVAEAATAKEFLSESADLIRGRLTEAEDSLAAYSHRHGAVALDTRAEEEVKNQAQLMAQRDLLESERAALATYLAQTKAGAGSSSRYRDLASFPTFLQNEAIAELVASLILLDNRRSDMSVLRTESNPELAAVNSRISEIETQLYSIASSYETALAMQVASHDATLARGTRRVNQIPRQQMEFLRRQREVDQLEEVYGTLESRLREAELAEGVGLPGVKAIDTPELPIEPSSPLVAVNLFLGTALGFGFGLLLAGYRELTDIRLRDRNQVEVAAGAPVIGMLPSLRKAGPLFLPPREPVTRALRRRNGGSAEIPAGWKEREWQPAVEAFKTLVSDLKVAGAGAPRGNGALRSLAVTSSAQGEGKTFTACNLALVWASIGVKTLLIDADLRAGGVGSFFKLAKDSPGFSDVLKGTAAASHVVQRIGVGGGYELEVLTAGQADANSAQNGFHLSGRVADTFEKFERDYELVIVDTPPLNVVSDSSIVSAATDAVLFVVRSGMTRPEALDLALQRLNRINRNLVGLVLNDVTLPSYYTSYYGSD